MSTDARISTGLPGHPKTKKLIRRLGEGAAWKLVRLFLWAAENRPDGDLTGMSAEDIELAIDWTGEPDAFVAELQQVGFLDGDACAWQIHDWIDHNPWLSGHDKRSAKARWNAIKRYHGIKQADLQVPEYAAIRKSSCDEAEQQQRPGDAGSSKTAASSTASSNATSKGNGNTQHAASNASSTTSSMLPQDRSSADVDLQHCSNTNTNSFPNPAPIREALKPVVMGDKHKEQVVIRTPAPQCPVSPATVCGDLKALGVTGINPGHALLQEAIAEGVSRDGFVAAAAIAKQAGKARLPYVVGVALNRHRDGSDAAAIDQADSVMARNQEAAARWAASEAAHADH